MDELVRHCLRELSFDGDLGCDVSRLRDFITEFYAHPGSTQGQTVDDAFCAFVWSVIVQQPGVRVGTVPEGGSTEVYIAAQASAIRKAKAKGEEAVEEPPPATGLDIVDDATVRPLDQLREVYGDKLRIAVDPETTFAALTGSHIRPSRLTPMIYTGLQIITRGREKGVSVLDLGKKSGYDQKTCFYLIKQLVELGLVVKLRQPGVSTNFCVHKYFYERSPIWQQISSEEKKAVSEEQAKDADGGSDDDSDQEETKPLAPVHFDPIDSRHLSSMPVLRSRLTKLLKNCPHNMHTSNNLMVKIGFVNPTRTDRRFFRTRLRELMDQGFIEKVHVPHADRRRRPDKKIPCIRLVTDDVVAGGQGEVVPMDEDDQEVESISQEDDTGLKVNVSLHRQMIDTLAEAGTKGMTLNELSVALGDFDKRTIDLLINRLEKDPPPPHLADLGIAQLVETHGRERRYKYYTLAHYLAMAEKEQVAHRQYSNVDMSAVGGFLHLEADDFYEDEEDLRKRMIANAAKRDASASKGKRKATARVNPILPDGSVKKGRPRKSVISEGDTSAAAATPSKKGRKRKRAEPESPEGQDKDKVTEEGTGEPPHKKKRGRKPKETVAKDTSQALVTPSSTRKRGRPKRQPPGTDNQAAESASTVAAASSEQSGVEPGPLPAEDGSSGQQGLTSSLSPLSDAPATPVPENASERATAAVAVSNVEQVAEAEAVQSQPNSSQTPALRRSTRSRQAKKRVDSLSPTRQSARKTGPSAGPSTVQADVTSAQERQIVEQTESTTQANAPVPLSFYVGAQTDIPIDPALLQTDSMSAMIVDEPLITMTPEPPEQPQAGPSSAAESSKKRDHPESPTTEPIAKRTKSGQSDGSRFRSKANLSQSRRENEILRLLTEANGILNTSGKEFYEAHAALVETIVAEGGTASTRAGTRIDKRTLEATLRELEAKEKVKVVTTIVPTVTASQRTVRIAILPDVPESALSIFLADLGQSLQTFPPPSTPVKTIDEPIEYGGGRAKPKPKGRASNVIMRSNNSDDETQVRASVPLNTDELFQMDDKVIRDALLSEKHTVAQMYGYIVGKAARARHLHIQTIGLFEHRATSSQIVSHEQRIVHISYYTTDLPIATYCSLISVLEFDPELGRLLQESADTPLHAVPENCRASLAPTHARSRARIFSLLEFLRVLGLVTPLTPSESSEPLYTCADSEQHPAAFDIAPDDTYTPAIAPQYWRFNDTAPVRLWVLGNGLPPVWKTVSVSTTEQAIVFWHDTEKGSTDLIFAQEVSGNAPISAGEGNGEVATVTKTLGRPISWSAMYNLSQLQTDYLRRYIDPGTGKTPLDDPEGGETLLQRLAWIVSASPAVVSAWYKKAQKKHLRDLRKVMRAKGKGKQQSETSGEVVRRRAAEAREQRERDWDEMVARVHPGELRESAAQRVQRVRTKFLQGSAKASEKWEAKILEAIQEADMVADKLLAKRNTLFPQKLVAKPAVPLAPVATSGQDRDVDELIAAQGTRAVKDVRPTKKSKKGKEKDTGEVDVKPAKRYRFLWTRDYDELVRDASVIIKARARSTRLDWGALEQVFPAVPRNSVRQRFVHLKETPGSEAYLARLEDKWYDLWIQHRGTDKLPDRDPESVTNFDLATHVKFLRKHIDKNAIRVGFVEVESSQNIDLPSSVGDIEHLYDVVEKQPNAPPWDFMWTVVAEEAREKQFAQNAFTSEIADLPPTTSYDSDFLHIADSAVKMALGNPHETYDADVASQFLKGVGEKPVRAATTELLNRGVLAKLIRDPTKVKPGRTLKISDSNQSALGGPLPRELFQDAAALEEAVRQQEDADQWQEWSLLASDGDTAFLLELVSENKVQFDVDTSHPRSMSSVIEWNSKKADDGDIETALRVRYVNAASIPREPPVPEESVELPRIGVDAEMQVDSPSPLEPHGTNVKGEPGHCRLTSEGLVDCAACLDEAKSSLLRELDADEFAVAESVFASLQEAGEAGLTKQQLLAKNGAFPPDTLFSVVERMTDAAVPLAHWTGYAALVLVSASVIKPWTVTVSDAHKADARAMIFPRRWLDIYGRKLDEVWEAVLRAVLGCVLLRPGISQAEIRWRLRSFYDRQEVCEVLQTLEDEGYLTSNFNGEQSSGPPDEREEKFTHWFLANSGRHWYGAVSRTGLL